MAVNHSNSATKDISQVVHAALPASTVTVTVTAITGFLAFQQFGPAGVWCVLAFSGSILTSLWATAWGAALLARNHPQLAALLASSGIRMIAPLAVALLIVLGNGRFGPVEAVYYVIPLYLCMLVADVIVWVREQQKPTGAG